MKFLEEIKDLFGGVVAKIVGALSEPKELPFDKRKAHYIRSVDNGCGIVVLVSCADKLHNLRSYATTGRELWKPETAAFYAQLMPIYEEYDLVPRHWIKEMNRLLGELPYAATALN